MFGAIVFLAALALVQGRPEIIKSYPNLWEPSDLCPPAEVHHLIPHESDCSKFYQCEYGMKRIEATNCAPGTLFSYEQQVCVLPWEADCNLPGPTPPVETTAPPVYSTAPPVDLPAPSANLPSQPALPNIWEPSDQCPPTDEHYLIPDESDCSMFYYCNNGLKKIYPTYCAPGSLFSYEQQVCVQPWEAECNQPKPAPPADLPSQPALPNIWEPSDECPPTDEHYLIPDESDCSMFYYCNNGLKKIYPSYCAPGSLFSYKQQVCVHPWEAECNQPKPAPPADLPSQPALPNIWEPSDECPPTDEHYLIPDESDCSMFYYCKNGLKKIYPTYCAPGSLFSYEQQVCVHPWEAECNQPKPALPAVLPSQPAHSNLWEPSDLCPPIHHHHLIPHESDCSKFYYCEYGMKRIDATDCAPGTVFSYEQQVCTHPWEAKCNLPGPAPPVDTPAPTTDAPAQPTYPNLWEPSDLCPPIHHHHLIPHESDCSKFYYCEYGMKRIDATDCAPGTLFSYEQQVCVHPWDADCNLPGPVDPTKPPAPEPTTRSTPDWTTIPTPGPSSTTTEEPCTTSPSPSKPPTAPPTNKPTDSPAPPTYLTTPSALPPTDFPDPPPTNKPTDAPVSPTSSPPSIPSTTTPQPDEDCNCEDGSNNCEVDYDTRCRDNCNLLPWAHATDCDKFWRCEGDKAVRVVCPEGLHFNPSTNVCDFMCNAGCVRRHTTTTTYADGLKIFVPFSEINGASTGLQSRIQKAIEHAKKG